MLFYATHILKNLSLKFYLVGLPSFIHTVGSSEHMLVRDQCSSTVPSPESREAKVHIDNPGELVRDGLLSSEDPHSGWSVRNSAIAIGSFKYKVITMTVLWT